MKLLTPSATQDTANQQTSSHILRIQELRKLESDFRIKVAKAEEEFNLTLAKNRKVWEDEESSHTERKKEMEREMAELEVKKLELLVPFDILKEGADGRMKDAKGFLEGLRKRESEVEERSELLEDKLDTIGEREESAKQLESALNLKKISLDSYAKSIKEQADRLTSEMTSFYAQKTKDEELIKDKTEALALKENELIAREKIDNERGRELAAREIRVADERRVLDDAWQEFKRMKS